MCYNIEDALQNIEARHSLRDDYRERKRAMYRAVMLKIEQHHIEAIAFNKLFDAACPMDRRKMKRGVVA